MHLRHLQYFVTVAETQHFGKAAKALGLTQPAISNTITDLERELCTKLLDRNRRSVSLTKAGQRLLMDGRQILASVEQAERAAQRVGRGESNDLLVGTVGAASIGRLPDILKGLHRHHPAVHVTPHEMTPDEQVVALLEERIDIGITYAPAQHKALEVVSLAAEPFVVALAAGHALARSKAIRLDALAGEALVCCPAKTVGGLHQQTRDVCRAHGFEPKMIREAPQVLSLFSLVAAHAGVGVVPASIAKLRHDGVVFRPLARPAPTVGFALIWRRDEESSAVKAFCDMAQATGNKRERKAG